MDSGLMSQVPYTGGMAFDKKQMMIAGAVALVVVLAGLYYYGKSNPTSSVGKSLTSMGLLGSSKPAVAKFRVY